MLKTGRPLGLTASMWRGGGRGRPRRSREALGEGGQEAGEEGGNDGGGAGAEEARHIIELRRLEALGEFLGEIDLIAEIILIVMCEEAFPRLF